MAQIIKGLKTCPGNHTFHKVYGIMDIIAMHLQLIYPPPPSPAIYDTNFTKNGLNLDYRLYIPVVNDPLTKVFICNTICLSNKR